VDARLTVNTVGCKETIVPKVNSSFKFKMNLFYYYEQKTRKDKWLIDVFSVLRGKDVRKRSIIRYSD
jgi:hypothetical protein